jgi:two-component system cell cycle sensor histidine kinase/response regulator CckA
MPPAVRASSFFSYRIAVGAILAAGIVTSIVSYRAGRASEEEHAEAQFDRRASVRHALTREVLSRYEDSLFGLSALFTVDANVSRNEFMLAASRLETRIAGAQAIEWVPRITQENRAALEAALQRVYTQRKFEFIDYDAGGQPRRAPERPVYYPITYIQPMRGNQEALGYDLKAGPTASFLERARESRQMTVTGQIRLVQEKAGQMGLVMILPVYRPPRPSAPSTAEVFAGFLQCVFRVHDMLETVCSRQPDGVLDMMFIDASEGDPTRRLLYHRPADDAAARTPAPEEAVFREGVSREHALAFGGREWRVKYRPRAGWMEAQYTSTPLLRSCSLLLLSGLLAGLVHLIARRTDTIHHEVDQRTAELAESRRQFASMLHALPGMAYRGTYDDQLSVLFVSDGALGLTGWTAEEFMTGAVHYRDCIHPDDLGRVREATRSALQEQRDVEVEYRLRMRSGDEKWVLSRGRGVYTADGKLHVFEGLVIDVTAQKNAENARLGLERKLLEGQKLESLGLLAGGIAHDFNNLLSSILGSASLARMILPENSEAEQPLRAIETASLRAADLCRQMLAYAGKGRFVIEPTDVSLLTEELLPLLRISVARHATLNLNLGRNLPSVLADATQLRQIVMNLVLNAADAIGDHGGEITLTTGVVHAGHAYLTQCVAGAGLPRGDYVFLEVRDTGCGMAPAVLEKIFDPFYTTKFAGRGLGLAAVLGIVRGHHGALRVESREGAGSSFRLLLPPGPSAAPAAKPTEAAAGGRWKRAGSVLLVEDEEPVRFVLLEMLKTFGLTPRGAADGEKGLAAFRENPAGFDLVIMDMLMPGMSGEQTLAAMREIKADVRVLLISGYSEGDILGRLGGAGPLRFLAKPFTREALEQKLREMLG